jgi:type IV pilus assembly protein PilF
MGAAMLRQFGLLLLVIMLAACVSTPDSESDSTPRKIAELNTQMGQGYMNRGQYEIALEKLKKAVKADPRYAPAHTVLGVLYERLGETELAEKHYAEAAKVAPDNGDANNNYGAFLCANGQEAKAEAYFNRALKDPFYSTPEVAMANAGQCMLRKGDMDKAESYLRQSLAYDDDFPDALLGLSRVNFAKGDYLRARAFLQRYEASTPMSASGLMLGQRIETQLGDAAGARRYADRLLEQFPKSPEAAQVRDKRL